MPQAGGVRKYNKNFECANIFVFLQNPNFFPNSKICIIRKKAVLLQRIFKARTMKTRLVWDKILRMGMKLCMLTGVAFTFAACYGVREPVFEFEASGDITNQENKPIENIEVTIKHRGWTMREKYSDEDGKYLIQDDYFPTVDSIDIVARDTTGIYEPDSVRVGIVVDYKTKKNKWSDGSFSVKQDFQLKKKE